MCSVKRGWSTECNKPVFLSPLFIFPLPFYLIILIPWKNFLTSLTAYYRHLVHSVPALHHISPALHLTRPQAANFIYTKIHSPTMVLWHCRLILYCSSISRKKHASSQPIFYCSIIGRGPYSNIYPDSSYRKGSNIKSILVALWPSQKPFLYLNF